MEESKKKVWLDPKLFVYGSVEKLTQDLKGKQSGSGDDLAEIVSSV